MSLLLDLSRLGAGVEKVHRRFEPAELVAPSEEFRVVEPANLDIEVRKDARKVRLVGRLQTAIECPCSRCLEPFRVPVDVALDTLFLPASSNAGDGELEIGEDDLGVSFYRDDV